MNKSDLIKEVALSTGQSKAKTAETINQAIATIQEAVSNGLTVSLNGFISLTPITKKACEGEINGTKYSKPERQGIKLKAMKPFKDLVEAGAKGVQDEK
jgi:DNA-binding protein HU-beta